MFLYIILGLLVFSVISLFLLPAYSKKIIGRANNDVVSRIKNLYQEGVNNDLEVKKILLSENHTEKDFTNAILAIKLEPQEVNKFLAPVGGDIGEYLFT
ncbi:MAG: hypothetical protein ACI9BF_000107 [Candidatus Paceibacteria bacterium]|jgi:hypothetical protein